MATIHEIKRPLKQIPREFVDECFEGSLRKAKKVIIIALMDDDNWEGFWQECKPSELAYAALLINNAAMEIGKPLEVEEK